MAKVARLSMVVPAFCEAENLKPLLPRLLAQQSLADRLQVVIVDDHSEDDTFGVVREWGERDPRVQGVRLARNSGSHAAILCGLGFAEGDAVVVLAADGQDPPETTGKLVEAWQQGARVVWAVRDAREGESRLTRLFSRTYYTIMNRWSSVRLPPTGADFLLLDRSVVDALLRIPEHNVSVFALIASLGFRQAQVPYVKRSRMSGLSKWTLRRKVGLLLDSILGFSTVPLRAATMLGFLHAAAGFVLAALLAANKLSGGRLLGVIPIQGWSGLMVVLLISSGILMTIMGIFGEYLWRALEEVRGRPRFLVEDSVNCAPNPARKEA